MERPCRNAMLAGGKYELVEEIGRGGMGTVWHARAVILDRPCAIKFLKPEVAEQATNRERFVNEARASARLRSPHTVTIFDVDFMNGVPFIAMELLPGESLERLLDKGPLSPRFTCALIRQVALGLSDAHAAGLVHRDLKPDNIYVLQKHPLFVKILDFGVAKNIHASMGFHTVTGAVIGTPYYMSPEQALGQAVDARCDLWSLGVLTYRCLTGRLPFAGDVWPEVLLKIVQGEIPALTSDEAAIPRAVDRWWRRVMSRNPGGRPVSALEFVEGLEHAVGIGDEFAGGAEFTESAIRMRSAGKSADRPLGRRTAAWVVGLGAACTLAAAAYVPPESELDRSSTSTRAETRGQARMTVAAPDVAMSLDATPQRDEPRHSVTAAPLSSHHVSLLESESGSGFAQDDRRPEPLLGAGVPAVPHDRMPLPRAGTKVGATTKPSQASSGKAAARAVRKRDLPASSPASATGGNGSSVSRSVAADSAKPGAVERRPGYDMSLGF
jgi:eukaryotic-like serine/threonine-protein kinase